MLTVTLLVKEFSVLWENSHIIQVYIKYINTAVTTDPKDQDDITRRSCFKKKFAQNQLLDAKYATRIFFVAEEMTDNV